VATILYGADINSGTKDATHYSHYDLLSTLLAASKLTGPRNAATAVPFNTFTTGASAGAADLIASAPTADSRLGDFSFHAEGGVHWWANGSEGGRGHI
jgi:hypothetical protein